MLRLMLADDEQYERDYLEKIINENYPTLLKIVCKAADGVEFMEKLEECSPHIILLDVKMPRMDGFETAKHIREKYPDVQIVIVSAYSDFAYAKQAMKLGISEYLLKPYLDSELCEVLDRVTARIKEREDTLSMLSYSGEQEETVPLTLNKDFEKDFLWNLFFEKKSLNEMKEAFGLQEISKGWLKVVLISTSALSSMGDFSKEVLENYFRMDGVIIFDSIWMNQMAICLVSEQKDLFTELNSCIRRARNYLVEEHQISVACGVSGAYYGLESLLDAYREAASFISEYSEPEVSGEFVAVTEQMKKICELEEQAITSLAVSEKNECLAKLTELVEVLEKSLEYQETAVKLNFGRSLLTVIRGINRRTDVHVSMEETMKQLGKMEQLNFNGEHLKDHVDFFAGMAVEKND